MGVGEVALTQSGYCADLFLKVEGKDVLPLSSQGGEGVLGWPLVNTQPTHISHILNVAQAI